KDRVVDKIHYVDWIIQETKEEAKVAVNALATAHGDWEEVREKLEQTGRTLLDRPLLDEVWQDRGTPVEHPVFVHPIERAGKSVVDKIEAIREKMRKKDATAHLISSLDDVAWTL